MGETDAGTGQLYEFEGFRLDRAERLLVYDGRVLPLTPKAFDLLAFFLEHPGTLIDKSTLLASVWPGTIVEEANLAFQVSALRKVLDAGRRDSLIQTVPTRGYRFVGTVRVASQPRPEATATAAGPATVLPGSVPDRRLPLRYVLALVAGIGLIALATLAVLGVRRQPVVDEPTASAEPVLTRLTANPAGDPV